MTDLGFGIVDKRSILVVLFTLFLASIFLGNKIPIDTASATTTLISLATLTGYIFIARTASRIFLVFILAILCFPFLFYDYFSHVSPYVSITSSQRNSSKSRSGNKTANSSISRLKIIERTLVISRRLATAFMNTTGNIYRGIFSSLYRERDWEDKYLWKLNKARGLLGLVDRISLIIITLLATFPQFTDIHQGMAIVGIITMLIVYVSKGNFTFVLQDAMEKSEEQQSRVHRAIINTSLSTRSMKDHD